MTDKLREAAQQALEVLKRLDEWLNIRSGGTGLMPDELNTITALREALAEQQEPVKPVAWIDITDGGQIVSSPRLYSDGSREERPLYTAPQPAKQPLTDDEIARIRRTITTINMVVTPLEIDFARAIERAHGIGETK